MSETVAHVLDTRYRTGDVEISENVDFEGLFLSKTILQGLNRAGFVRPSPIQLKAIPIGRCGLDLIIQAKSGTGKTCVFTVIALENVIPENNRVQSLILAPTREIAFQNAHVVQSIGSSIQKLRSYAFTGGIPLAQDKLKLKCCHVATGTPGRIKQLIEEGTMITDNIRLFVLDEADKLLEEGFQDVINWIYAHLPENKQIIAASATYTDELAQFLMRYMRNPTFVRLNSSDPALLGVKQYFKVTAFHTFLQKVFDEKVKDLLQLLNKISFNQCIIFSNYQARAQLLCDLLTSKGWPTMYISGSQDQQQRMHVMSTLHNFKCRILISTDLTSRGIDAEHVNLVLNLDVPWDKETYLHRIGRAGRFGTVGIAITFASEGKEEELLMKIKNDIGLQLIPLPDRIDNTIWQLGTKGKVLTPTYSQESIDKAPIAKEESTNPFETSSKVPDEDQKPPSSDFNREKKRDSLISKSSNSTRNSSDSASTDQSVHTVISRCQSLVDENLIEPESNEDIKPSLPSVISRCESTDEVVAEKKEDVNAPEEEEYVPTSVKNRIHEFERYIVKLIQAGDVKSDPVTSPSTDAATKKPSLKDMRDMPLVRSSTSSVEYTEDLAKSNTPRRLVKSETWDSHEIERKGLTKAKTLDALPSATEDRIQPKTFEFKRSISSSETDIEIPKSATLVLQSLKNENDQMKKDDEIVKLRKEKTEAENEEKSNTCLTKSTLEIKLSDTKNIKNDLPTMTESYKDLEMDLLSYIDDNFGQGDCIDLVQATTKRDKVENLVGKSESGDDEVRISTYADEYMKKICSLEFKPTDEIFDDWKKCHEHWERFKDEIQVIDSGQSEGEDQTVPSTEPEIEKNVNKIEPNENLNVESDISLPEISFEEKPNLENIENSEKIENENIEKANEDEKEGSIDIIQSDVVDRVTLLSKMTSEHEWIFTSSSVEAPDTENEEKESESDLTTSETDNSEPEKEEKVKAESSSSRERILPDESATEYETTEDDEETSSESTENGDSESAEIAEEKSETISVTENSPEMTQWTDYWKSFSDWASQMHKSTPTPDPPIKTGDQQFPFAMPPFSFSASPFPPQMPMQPQMPNMWPQFQNIYPGSSPFNTCCNCSMASAWWNQYWSFCYWQMMMMQKSQEKKQ